MKKHILDFAHRGALACGIGPLVLAVLYLILDRQEAMQPLSAGQVSTGIISLMVLAFIAGGMNSIYQVERLPIMAAVGIHGTVLYICYLITYLINDWLEWSMISVLVFTGVFIVGYLVIWAVIGAVIRRRTARINELLKLNHLGTDV